MKYIKVILFVAAILFILGLVGSNDQKLETYTVGQTQR